MKVTEQSYKWAYALTPRSQTTHLILHHSGGSGATAQGIHAYHLSKGWSGIAYHYYVRKSGEIVRGRPEQMRGGHTTDWNYCSIGVCFEGNFETEQMPAQQIAAGAQLVADIRARYPSIVVGRHCDFGNTACPGKNFPFEEIVSPAAGDMEQDEAPDDWAKKSCDWAVEQGLFAGDGESGFHWHELVTRQDLAVLLMRFSACKK